MPEVQSVDADGEEWLRKLMSGELKFRRARGWRACHIRLMGHAWYRWFGGRWASLKTRLVAVPLPVPSNMEVPMMRFRICLWEPGSYVSTGRIIPDTGIELLMHHHCNRIVGIKIWE